MWNLTHTLVPEGSQAPPLPPHSVPVRWQSVLYISSSVFIDVRCVLCVTPQRESAPRTHKGQRYTVLYNPHWRRNNNHSISQEVLAAGGYRCRGCWVLHSTSTLIILWQQVVQDVSLKVSLSRCLFLDIFIRMSLSGSLFLDASLIVSVLGCLSEDVSLKVSLWRCLFLDICIRKSQCDH